MTKKQKKVLIIEDVVDDYYRIAAVLDQYDVSYYPGAADCEKFSDTLARWADKQTTDTLDKVRTICQQFGPDYILLDIGLKATKPEDKTGLILNEILFAKDFQGIPVYKITGRYVHDEITESIAKNGDVSLEQELYEKFITENDIGPAVSTDNSNNPNGTNPSPDENELKRRFEKNKRKFSRPRWLETLRNLVQNKVTPVVQFIIDTGITYIFYALMAFLGAQGPLMIYESFKKHPHQILVVAETAFVAFLPLLVVFGFFVFYIMSLRPYITGAKVTDEINFEKTSKLLIFTKKLFISSLISYLFTKLVEHLFLDKPEAGANYDNNSGHDPGISDYFNKFHHSNTPLIQLYATGAAIVLLALYYLYLSSHHPENEHHKEKAPSVRSDEQQHIPG